MDLDEKSLVQRARKGDRFAFEALVRHYQRRVFRVAFGMLRDEEDAIEVAQEAFVKAYKNLDKFKGDSAFYTWLHRITSNLCIDLLRRRRGEGVEYDDAVLRDSPEQDVGDIAPRPFVAPSRAVLDRELGDKLNEAMSGLSDSHRQILVLREVEGLSYEELADTLGIKKGTVMSRLFHARKNMQARLQAYLSAGELAELTGEAPPAERDVGAVAIAEGSGGATTGPRGDASLEARKKGAG